MAVGTLDENYSGGATELEEIAILIKAPKSFMVFRLTKTHLFWHPTGIQ